MPLRRTLMASVPNRKGLDMNANVPDRNALSGEARKLLETLLLKVGEADRVQIATSRLLKDTGLTEGALVRARSELIREQLLRTEPGFLPSGLRGANVYVLNMIVLDPPKEEAIVEPVPVDLIAAEPVAARVLEVEEEALEPSRRRRSERKGFLGFFRRSGATS